MKSINSPDFKTHLSVTSNMQIIFMRSAGDLAVETCNID